MAYLRLIFALCLAGSAFLTSQVESFPSVSPVWSSIGCSGPSYRSQRGPSESLLLHTSSQRDPSKTRSFDASAPRFGLAQLHGSSFLQNNDMDESPLQDPDALGDFKQDFVCATPSDSTVLPSLSRRHLLKLPLLLSTVSLPYATVQDVQAAPPISIIAEELGYFPVTNSKGETVNVPKRVQRESSPQAVELAQHLQKTGVVMYGAYWCPHCARQKELFGQEAWNYINYVECAPKGYNANVKLCNKNDIDGFPTWKFKPKQVTAGEVPLSVLAEASQFPREFRDDQETNLPPMLGSGSCK